MKHSPYSSKCTGAFTPSENHLSLLITRGTVTTMKRAFFLIGIVLAINARATVPEIYHDGWIDFNRNGTKDVFEDVAQPLEKRVADLLAQMTLEEKIGQMHQTTYDTGAEKLLTEMPDNELLNFVALDIRKATEL